MSNLLIVPYGIETLNTERIVDEVLLLIVPYGIETNEIMQKSAEKLAF